LVLFLFLIIKWYRQKS